MRAKGLTVKAYAAAQGLPVTDELKQTVRELQRKAYAERDRVRHLSKREGVFHRRNLKWGPILERAAEIVRGYDTPVTLRQLFYRLVVEALIVNTMSRYNQLSTLTAAARRDGWFPKLSDTGRSIHRYESWDSPAAALRDAAEVYLRDRTEGQPTALYVAVEKMTLTAQVQSWFGDLGIRILSLRGYSSESYEREIAEDVYKYANGRQTVILYAGDFDPTGEDIVRNFKKQLTDRGVEDWTLERVAITEEQVDRYGLPEAPGKADDPRAAGFAKRHGRLVQVEVEALDPDILRGLFQDAIDQYWDNDAYEAILDIESDGRAEMLSHCEDT